MSDEHYTNSKWQVFPYHVFQQLDPNEVCKHLAKVSTRKGKK